MKALNLQPVVREYTHLIAFDFDQTLSCVQVFTGEYRTAKELFGGESRVRLLDQFLSFLKQESARKGFKFRIIIISFNFRNTITRRLKELKMSHHFEAVYDRADVTKAGGYSKGKGN